MSKFTALLFLITRIGFGQPLITFINPSFGEIGSTITISGNNFSPNSIENTVFFGGLEANVIAATENELMVSVPYGAYYTPISVYTNGLYATSSQCFNVTFNATEELTVDHLSSQLNNPYLGRKYYDIRIADMNGDNVAEIATSEAGYGSSAYLAIFTTSFDDEGMISIDQHIEFNFGTGVYSVPQDIALGDLNGDGLLDVVTSEKGDVTDDFEAHTCIFINTSQNENFSFESPIIIDGDGYEGFSQLQDINGDGKLDIVTSRQSYNQLGIYLNTSDDNSVSFASKIIIENVVAAPRPAFADLNGDGMIDMVATAYLNNGRDIFIYSNNSTEENIDFNLEMTVLAGGLPPAGYNDYNWSSSNPTLADIDGDGKLDIIVTNGNCGFGCSPSGISVIKNISTDSELLFEYEHNDFYQYQSNPWPLRIGISDLNGDGKPDILTTDWLGGISILVNNSNEGNIEFADQMQIGVGNYPLSVATADLNMDSTPEIIVANWEVEGLRVIHNSICVLDEACIEYIYGCVDQAACNYNSEANTNDESCEYPQDYYDCEGNCLLDTDADLVCDVFDNCVTIYNDDQLDYDLDGEGDLCDYDDGLGFDEAKPKKADLVKMIDVLGRDCQHHLKGQMLFYIYSNGRVIKQIKF